MNAASCLSSRGSCAPVARRAVPARPSVPRAVSSGPSTSRTLNLPHQSGRTPSGTATCRSAEVAETVSTAGEAKEQLDAAQLELWQSCHLQLTDTGLTEEDADRLLAKGFAWTSRAYWGLDKANVVPDPEDVSEVLQYLQFELGITGPDLVKVLKMFPEVMACSIEERLKPNIQRFEDQWMMKGDVLKRAIVRKPSQLGLCVDCSTVANGACMGQCSKCWSAN